MKSINLQSFAQSFGKLWVFSLILVTVGIASVASEARPLLGFTPWKIDFSASDNHFDFAKRNGDLISIHDPSMAAGPANPQTIGGRIPFDAFRIERTYEGSRRVLAKNPATKAWLDQLDSLKAQSVGKPIYLSEEFLKSRRFVPESFTAYPKSFLVNGKPSFTRLSTREALANFALFLVYHFEPIAFTPFVELNLSYNIITQNPDGLNATEDEWSGVLMTYAAIYKKVKRRAPVLPIFPSFLWNVMLLQEGGPAGTDLIRSVNAAAPVDMIGISTYPNSPLGFAKPKMKPSDLPANFFERARDVIPGRTTPVTIAEFGWWANDPQGLDQLEFIQIVLREAERLQMPFVINFFAVDPVAQTPEGPWVLPMGFQGHEAGATPKPALGAWNQFRYGQ